MEEILASIRRIISEEETGEEAVLDLTQTAADETADADDLLVFDSAPEKPAEPPARTAPPPRVEPVRAAEPIRQQIERDVETIVSEPVVSAASSSLTRLAGALRIADAPGQTLEGMVRQMLTPLLKDWLDQNLPAIVEAKVEAELERIARLAR